MCVIYMCKTKWPSEAELKRGANRNDDGAGIAWLAPRSKEDQTLAIHFAKGFADEKAVLEFIKKEDIQLPAAIHFRTVSAGLKCPELCHPFPVVKGAPLWTSGYANEVLFHNGHMHDWENMVLQAGLKESKTQFPEGEWSDTRAMVWLTYLKGHGILPFIVKGSRVLLFNATPNTLGTKEYSKAVDHFTTYGTWLPGDGFEQSTMTEWTNRGGVVIYGDGKKIDAAEAEVDETVWSGWDDHEWPTRTGYTAKPSTQHINEWDLAELNKLVTSLEGEQMDAQLAAGL